MKYHNIPSLIPGDETGALESLESSKNNNEKDIFKSPPAIKYIIQNIIKYNKYFFKKHDKRSGLVYVVLETRSMP